MFAAVKLLDLRSHHHVLHRSRNLKDVLFPSTTGAGLRGSRRTVPEDLLEVWEWGSTKTPKRGSVAGVPGFRPFVGDTRGVGPSGQGRPTGAPSPPGAPWGPSAWKTGEGPEGALLDTEAGPVAVV